MAHGTLVRALMVPALIDVGGILVEPSNPDMPPLQSLYLRQSCPGKTVVWFAPVPSGR